MSVLSRLLDVVNNLGSTILVMVFNIMLYPLSRYVFPRMSYNSVLAFYVIVGTGLVLFLFGIDSLLAIAMGLVTYVTLDSHPALCIGVSFVISSLVHIYCMCQNLKGWKWMIDGLTMIIFQKTAMTTVNLFHGRQRREGVKLRDFHERVALDEKMGIIHWFSYIFTPYGFASGPNFEYKMHEHMLRIGERPRISDDSKSHKRARRRIMMTFVWIVVTLYGLKHTDISFYSRDFFVNSNVVVRLALSIGCTLLQTIRYFSAWQAVEAGIYETGVAESGLCDFDDVTNLTTLELVTSSSVREWMGRWNHSAHVFWKRYVFYPLLDAKYGHTFSHNLTFLGSALWHGFHPVYYLVLPEMLLAASADRIINELVPDIWNKGIVISVLYRIWIVVSMVSSSTTWWYRTFEAFLHVRKAVSWSGTIVTVIGFVVTQIAIRVMKPKRASTEKKTS